MEDNCKIHILHPKEGSGLKNKKQKVKKNKLFSNGRKKEKLFGLSVKESTRSNFTCNNLVDNLALSM